MIHLHVHTQSCLDADMNIQKVIETCKKNNWPGIAVTNHGVVSDLFDLQTVFCDNGLKLGWGCEFYVDGGVLGRLHACGYAKNNNGWKGISKLVTLSNRNMQGGYPIVTFEMIKNLFGPTGKYHGDAIFTSACMQGIIPAIFRSNDAVTSKIEKTKRKQSRYESPCSGNFAKTQDFIVKHNAELERLVKYKSSAEKNAKLTFVKREKAIAKMPDSPEKAKAEKLLAADKKAKETAVKDLPEIKRLITSTRRTLSEKTKTLQSLQESIDKWFLLESEIEDLKKQIKTDDILMEEAAEAARKYVSVFGDDFYIELQYHHIPEEVTCFQNSLKIAKMLNIPLTMSNDVHIIDNSEEERLRRQILKSIRFDNYKEENTGDDELYFKTEEEMRNILSEIYPEDAIDEAIANTDKIFSQLNVSPVKEKHYPKIQDNTGRTSEEIFMDEIKNGVLWRFPEGMDEKHTKKLEYEIGVIKKMDVIDYLLVVKDFLEYARLCGFVPETRLEEAPLTIEELKVYIKNNGWTNPGFSTGPGRGSGVGSLVCFILGITHIDPLKYDLLFERFLNPERVSMPDIDSDIAKGVREKAIAYVRHKYGSNAVCLIMTKNAQAPKGCVRISARFYGQKKYGEKLTSLGDQIAKKIPFRVGVTFQSVYDEDDKTGPSVLEYLQKEYTNNKDALEIIRWASIIEGIFTSYGEHAAGVVISDNDDVSDYVPLRYNSSSGQMDTQCNMVQVEDNGMLKMDFLGLKTLNIITDAMRFIEQEHGIIIDPLKIDLNDSRVYENILAKGLTNAVFQLESSGMKNMLKRFKPTCFEDLIILVSMFRPGPLQYLDDVIKVKNKEKPMTFLCPELKPILEKTYSAIVYQEQVMQICQQLAGYTLGGADTVRRYMSKKKTEKLKHERPAFIQGDKKRGIDGFVKKHLRLMDLKKMSKEEIKAAVLEARSIANKLFDQMEDFAKYAFNKSHAAAYAFNAFVTAWLKYYYPAEFFAAAMNWAANDKKIAALMHETQVCGVTVKCPNINLSQKKFSIHEGKILFGLSAIKGIKNNADKIIEARKNGFFTSVKDVITRSNISVANVVSLISAGAMDDFSENRAALKLNVQEIKDTFKKIKDKEKTITTLQYVLEHFHEINTSEDAVQLQLNAGFSVVYDKLGKKAALEKRISQNIQSLELQKELLDSFVVVDNMPENRMERMTLEKQILGIYVTAHPIDLYPEQDISEIENLTADTKQIFGVIENMEIKYRKADGKPMAFFELTDKSGSVNVSCFTKSFEKNGALLKEGHAFILTGNVIEEVSGIDEETGMKIYEYSFVCEKVQDVEETQDAFYFSVSSYPLFHITEEEQFIAKYKSDRGGHPLYIYDEMTEEMRLAQFKVTDSALEVCVM